jgi:integrase/recombinase XerD
MSESMEEQIREFLDAMHAGKGYSRNTIEAYRNDLTQLLNFLLNERPSLSSWGRVDKPLLLLFVLHLKERQYTPSSVARKIAVVKSFYHFLLDRNAIESDPTATLGAPKVEKRLPQILSSDEIERLLAAPARNQTPKGFRDRAILELLFATGMRVSELTGLDTDQVNLTSRTVHCGARGGKRRVIPISERVANILDHYVQRGRAVTANAGERALFVNPHGERLTRQGLWLIIKEYVRDAEIAMPVTPHTLRHSFAVQMLNRGEDLQSVQRMLGHANVATTQVYARIVEGAAGEDSPERALAPINHHDP